MVTFDRSPFKLFTLRFSCKSVQAPSFEKPKTTRRTLFLSFEINNCQNRGNFVCHVVNSNIAIETLPTLQISVGVIIALFERRADSYRLLQYRVECTIPLCVANEFFYSESLAAGSLDRLPAPPWM